MYVLLSEKALNVFGKTDGYFGMKLDSEWRTTPTARNITYDCVLLGYLAPRDIRERVLSRSCSELVSSR